MAITDKKNIKSLLEASKEIARSEQGKKALQKFVDKKGTQFQTKVGEKTVKGASSTASKATQEAASAAKKQVAPYKKPGQVATQKSRDLVPHKKAGQVVPHVASNSSKALTTTAKNTAKTVAKKGC